MPPRIWHQAEFICSSCRHAIRRNDIRSRRPISHAVRQLARHQEIDDFYAQLLSEPLPSSARTTHSVFTPVSSSSSSSSSPSPSTSTVSPSTPSSTPRPPAKSSSPSSSHPQPADSSSASPPPPSATRPPPAPSKAAKPLTVDRDPELASRAHLVFGSRLVGPEERAARARGRDAAATLVAGVRVPPRPAEPDNCCMSGCVNCVWDLYREELEEWAARRREAQAALLLLQKQQQRDGVNGGRQERGGLGEGLETLADTGSAGAGATAAAGTAVTGGDAQLVAQQQVTGGAMGQAAISMDDDGGGSDTNWDAEDALLPSSGSALFASVPVGIREFMRTEKRLGQKRRERDAARTGESDSLS